MQGSTPHADAPLARLSRFLNTPQMLNGDAVIFPRMEKVGELHVLLNACLLEPLTACVTRQGI